MTRAAASDGVTTPTRMPRGYGAVALAAAVALGCAGMLGADRAGLGRTVGFAAGAVAALLAVLGLPSVPTRIASVAILTLGGLVVVRHAAIPGADAAIVATWAGATTAALVALEHVARPGVRPLTRRRPAWPGALGAGAGVVAAVAVLAVPLAPVVQAILEQPVRLGEEPGIGDMLESERSLRSTDRLDMSRRPRLSDRVVMTVDAPAPAFWRGATYDTWDGVAWTRTEARAAPRPADRSGRARLAPAEHDPAPGTGTSFVQRYTMEARYADIVFAAPSPVEVEIAQRVAQFPDGTVAARDPLGRGTTYTVTSQVPDATEATLRASATRPVPEAVTERYARAPVVTPRVAAAARAVAGDAATPYDAVRALERWMGARTRYSIDAPLPPRGADVVDHFLFDARLGWCEQVASSLVVMLRTLGIPARLAVGFVPGDLHAFSGRFVVRERHAHAWAEVYFPGVGWQGFDPTAEVPLAGEAAAVRTPLDRLRDLAPVVVLLVAVAGAAYGGARGLGRLRAARRTRTWASRQLGALERVGRGAGCARAPQETPRAYGQRLAATLGDPRPVEVADAIDVDAYSAAGLGASRRREVEQVVAAVTVASRRRRPVVR